MSLYWMYNSLNNLVDITQTGHIFFVGSTMHITLNALQLRDQTHTDLQIVAYFCDGSTSRTPLQTFMSLLLNKKSIDVRMVNPKSGP